MTHENEKNWSGEVAEVLRAGEGFSLSDVDPESTPGYDGGKSAAKDDLATGIAALDELQERLYAESRTDATDAAVLLVLQAMDSAGKGGILRHVVGSVDPQGIHLTAFKKPTDEELEHDFLWRVERRLPSPGYIGVFDRSQYEDVLIAKVRGLASEEEIERRYGAINDFEQRVAETGTRIVKVMLYISYEEQGERLAERLERPDKHWKYNPDDIDERARWSQYMDAYQTVFERTSTQNAPWFIVPANRKWYARLAVQQLLLGALREIDPQWPLATFDVEAEKKRLAAT